MTLLRSVSVNLAELRRVLGHSSGAPGGGVAAVGTDDVARFSLAKVGATCLNRCWVVSKKQSACLGSEAIGSRIGVPSFGVDPTWGNKVVSATENITFGGNC